MLSDIDALEQLPCQIALLEIAAIILVLTSIAMLQIGRQKALRQIERAASI